MSIFFPYNVTDVIIKINEWFSIDLSAIADYQKIIICVGINLYFFIIWWFIIWCILKGLNWVYERLF